MYYLTHDDAGHQIFLLEDNESESTIVEDVENGAISYKPGTGAVKMRLGTSWKNVASGGGGGGQPVISDDVDFNNYSIENLNELYAEFIALSEEVRLEANNGFLDLGANDGEGDYTAPVHLTGLDPNPTYANEATCKSYVDGVAGKNVIAKFEIDGDDYGYIVTPLTSLNTYRPEDVYERFMNGQMTVFYIADEINNYYLVPRLYEIDETHYMLDASLITYDEGELRITRQISLDASYWPPNTDNLELRYFFNE